MPADVVRNMLLCHRVLTRERHKAWGVPQITMIIETNVDARTRSSVIGRDHHSCWRARLELMALDPQTSAAGPRTSPDVEFSLEIRILDLCAFRWTKANGGQTHS